MATNKPAVRAGNAKRVPRGTNSTGGAVLALANAAAGPPKCPKHLELREVDKPFWDDIMRARALEEWGRNELTLAWQLAQVQGDIKLGRALIESGDREAMDEQGFPSVRAVSAHLGNMVQQQLQLMRALRIVGNVVGDPADVIPRRKAEREAEQTLARMKGSTPAGTANEPPLLSL